MLMYGWLSGVVAVAVPGGWTVLDWTTRFPNLDSDVHCTRHHARKLCGK